MIHPTKNGHHEDHENMYHNTFKTENYHFIGKNQGNTNGNTNVYSINGNATTSSGGSSSGYDTLSITTNLGAVHVGHDNFNTSGGSGGSMNINGPSHLRSDSTLIKMNKQENNMYSDLGREELNSLMNDAIIGMDLPPDKLKIVKLLPDEKKLQVIRSMQLVSEKEPPEYYIRALTTYIDGISSQKNVSYFKKIDYSVQFFLINLII